MILLGFAVNNLYVHLNVVSWENKLLIKLFPINGDGSKVTEEYIESLTLDDIKDISLFLNAEANKYHVANARITSIELGDEMVSSPPLLPKEMNVFTSMYWSLYFRIWANWQLFINDDYNVDVAVFVLYFDPSKYSSVAHSVGLQKGMLVLVNAYSDRSHNGSNNVIIAHEILHTFGATDKYDAATNFPIYPVGYAEPGRLPLYPQQKAEIMGGRRPVSSAKAITPSDLNDVVVGEATAYEISWLPIK